MQGFLLDLGVGEHIAEHRRHIRLDHTRTFSNAGNHYRFAPNLDFHRARFRDCVSGHDAFGGIQPILTECGKSIRDTGGNLRDREILTNHACREREYRIDRHTCMFRHIVAGGERIIEPALSSTSVRIARVH